MNCFFDLPKKSKLLCKFLVFKLRKPRYTMWVVCGWANVNIKEYGTHHVDLVKYLPSFCSSHIDIPRIYTSKTCPSRSAYLGQSRRSRSKKKSRVTSECRTSETKTAHQKCPPPVPTYSAAVTSNPEQSHCPYHHLSWFASTAS